MPKQRTPPTPAPPVAPKRDLKRKRSRHERVMADLLFLRIHQSARPMRDICRALGYAPNDLSRVFSGYKKLEIEVLYEVLGELGIPPLRFFEDLERMLPYERDPEDADLIRTRHVTPERAERFVHKAEGKLFRLFGKDLDREALIALKAELDQIEQSEIEARKAAEAEREPATKGKAKAASSKTKKKTTRRAAR